MGYLVWFLALALFTVVLGSAVSGFWDGYLVEFAGILLELSVVYALFEKLNARIKKDREATQREPVMRKLREYVVALHVFLFESLDMTLTNLQKCESGNKPTRKITDLHDYKALNSLLDQLFKLLSHASNHLDIDTYGRLLDYIDSVQDLIRVVRFAETTKIATIPFNPESSIPRTEFSIQIKYSSLRDCENFYLWLTSTAKESTNSFFTSAIMQNSINNLAGASELIDKASSLKAIKDNSVVASTASPS